MKKLFFILTTLLIHANVIAQQTAITSVREPNEIASDSLKSILKNIGERFNLFSDIEELYNDQYFRNYVYKPLSKNNIQAIQDNSYIVSAMVIVSPTNSERYIRAQKIMYFNRLRVVMDSITVHVLQQRYNEQNVTAAIMQLQSFPNYDFSPGLLKYKLELEELLVKYKEMNCLANSTFQELANKLKNYPIRGNDPTNFYKKEYLGKGISEQYTYLKKAFDIAFKDPDLYGSPGYDLPDTCVKEILEVPQSTEEEEKPVEESTPAEE